MEDLLYNFAINLSVIVSFKNATKALEAICSVRSYYLQQNKNDLLKSLINKMK